MSINNKKVYFGKCCDYSLGYVLAETNYKARVKFVNMNKEFLNDPEEAEGVNVWRCKTLDGLIKEDIDCVGVCDDELKLLKDKGLAVWDNELKGYSFNVVPHKENKMKCYFVCNYSCPHEPVAIGYVFANNHKKARAKAITMNMNVSKDIFDCDGLTWIDFAVGLSVRRCPILDNEKFKDLDCNSLCTQYRIKEFNILKDKGLIDWNEVEECYGFRRIPLDNVLENKKEINNTTQ